MGQKVTLCSVGLHCILSSEKTFERKLKEMALTKKLEKNYSKDEILESYLNVIFFGNSFFKAHTFNVVYHGFGNTLFVYNQMETNLILILKQALMKPAKF